MNPRPRSITIIGWLFIAVGVLSLIGGLLPGRHKAGSEPPLAFGHLLAHFLHLLAIIGGVFLLRGCNWARWLLVAWMGVHIVIGARHGLGPTLLHIGIFGTIGYFLFLPNSSKYFRGRNGPA